ncbi:MAG: phosphotransferase [Bacillota bacterium]|jgi:CotS family spore coat protein
MGTDVRGIIYRQWRIKVSKVSRFGPVWKVKSKHGYFCFKRWKRRISHLLFAHHVIEELWQRGYSGTPRFIPTVQGKPYIEEEGDIYVLTRWMGRPLKERSKREWVGAAKELAHFHNASENMILPPGIDGSYFSGRWLDRFPMRIEETRTLFAQFEHPQNVFEEEVLINASVVLGVAESAYERLLRSRYRCLSDNLYLCPRLCHGNIKGKNFTITEEGNVCIIDPDSFRFDLPVQDLASFFTSALSSMERSLSLANILFNSYDAIRQVEEDEMPILKALLMFPYDLCKLLQKYQEGGKSPEAYLKKWNKELIRFSRHQYFLEQWLD